MIFGLCEGRLVFCQIFIFGRLNSQITFVAKILNPNLQFGLHLNRHVAENV